MGNPVTNHLPAHLDNFLQDVAQMYGTITYGDIIDFHPKKNQVDELNDLSIEMENTASKLEFEEDWSRNPDLQTMAEKVAKFVKGR